MDPTVTGLLLAQAGGAQRGLCFEDRRWSWREHVGDLAYADADGFCWFAGRAGDWLRVDGENLGTAPIERALRRHPAIAEAAVYAVPDAGPGDQVMACVVLHEGASLTPAEFGAFLGAQGDLGSRQHPRFVRIAGQMPRTPTFKVLTRLLAADRWNAPDPVWWRPGRSAEYVVLGPEQAAALDAAVSAARPGPGPWQARPAGRTSRAAPGS